MVGRVMASVAYVTSRLFRRPSIDSSAPQRDVLAPVDGRQAGGRQWQRRQQTLPRRPAPKPPVMHVTA